MVKIMRWIYLLLPLTSLMGCSLIFNTIDINVPKGGHGWYYIIPVKDTAGFNFEVSSANVYKVNKDGVAYIPAKLINKVEDLRVKVYEDGKDITPDVRYLGQVEMSNTNNAKRYNYIHFFIPGDSEKDIAADEAYWRESNYKDQGDLKFDSLFKKEKIIFK
ncbi:hypothetical protein ECE50_001805 [Chitinophaga sp. Mgbs1]|uniref:Lipoprotein n=1 Tax=Chitinophaga solisilvae TaxID=1233460 RepID=A0A9Q5CWC2_9BACT|nr:hypothetical protein [Chitinophaga solisilvae]